MSEVIWETFHHQTNGEAELTKLEGGTYNFVVQDGYGGNSAIDLDRKELKDLFSALGHELGHWS